MSDHPFPLVGFPQPGSFQQSQTFVPLESAVESVLTIHSREIIKQANAEGARWLGTLLVPPEDAQTHLTPRFRALGYTAFVHTVDGSDDIAIIAAPGVIQPTSSRLWLSILLFVLTVASTIITGALSASPTGAVIWKWGDGIMYSATLLSILLAHELGHYIASRRLGVAASYPFFIPLPFLSLFGTMGAFIAMKEPPPDRRALFTIAVAGPLAGLILAIPLTFLGLTLSTVEPFPVVGGYIMEGNNLLYGAMKWLLFGQWLPTATHDVFVHPIAWAGWAGLLVTMLNLLPAGQLDGGHIIYSLVGRRWAQYITWGVIGVLALLGFVWSGWWLWAVLISFLGNRHSPILNDVTPLGPRQRLLGVVAIIAFILLFTPTPIIQVPPGR